MRAQDDVVDSNVTNDDVMQQHQQQQNASALNVGQYTLLPLASVRGRIEMGAIRLIKHHKALWPNH